MTDTSNKTDLIPKAIQFRLGDPRYVQAKRVWVILVAHVMMKSKWREGYKKPCQQDDIPLINYGDLAKVMGMDPRAGVTLVDALGIVGQYCRLNGLPTLNSIVVNSVTGAPGDHVVVRAGKTYQDEQFEVIKEDWFLWRTPTTGALRKVRDYIKDEESVELEEEPDTPKSATREILDGTEKILREEGRPMLSGEILKRLNERGIYVRGRNPSTNLSSKISQARHRFVSNGRRKGWSLN